MRRALALLLAASVLFAGCNSELGQATPACGEDMVTGAIIISAQAVPGSAYAPCIAGLKPGWEYEPLVPRSGQSRFWLSSDRVGFHFLEVTFEAGCDIPPEAQQFRSDEPEIPLYIAVAVADYVVEVTIVPEGDDPDHHRYADEVAQQLGSSRSGARLVRAGVDASPSPTSERIAAALDAGRAVMVVGDREHEEHTVELHLREPDGETEVIGGIDLRQAIEEVSGPLGDPRYQAVWFYPFEGGCVTYRFDAEGPGADSIASEVKEALGFTDLAPLRELGRQVGYVLP